MDVSKLLHRYVWDVDVSDVMGSPFSGESRGWWPACYVFNYGLGGMADDVF